ncbi:MAG: Sec-independent protein translocase protein TatB [Casimicrobiaceae bacterium]
MFDIGFSEIFVIAVVALVVIGPEKLPKTARTIGVLFGRLQRYVTDVKADISREMEIDELRKLQQEMKSAATDIKQSMESAAHGIEAGARDIEAQLNASAGDTPSPVPAAQLPGTDALSAESARQAALPGFEKI